MKLPRGFLVSGINCGIKKKKYDLGLIYCKDFARAVGFFTTNANPSYSVLVSKKNIVNPIKAVLVNSGNANCFSQPEGLLDTEEIIETIAKLLKVEAKNILIASTGIIGKRLPKEKILTKLEFLIKKLGNNLDDFSSSIMTTDTFKKIAYSSIKLEDSTVNIIGFAKGAGMIYPNMATLLAFVLTDAGLDLEILKNISSEALEESFNSINIDGCMSTNDTFFVLSSNKIFLKDENIHIFSKNFKKVCLDLAKMIVKDAEGATKFIEIEIKGATSEEEAKKAARAITNSNLFKCAMYGSNPNFGRIISALGQASINVKEDKLIIKASPLKKEKIKLLIDLGKGNFSYKMYTCDLTPKYIKINAEYS